MADSVVDAGRRGSSGERERVNLWAKLVRVFRMFGIFVKFTIDKPKHTRPQGVIPVVELTREALLAAPDRSLWRLGHSTVLLKLRGAFWLTDPVFARRASPIWFLGPKRFHEPPISIKDLPPIKAVILSHDHYDHLDKRAIRKLAQKAEHLIAPKGVGQILIGWGVDAKKVRELDWWQETEVDGIRLVETPTQHFSGRGLWNRNQTLWASFVVIDRGRDGEFRLFYNGDSGYFEGYRQIGEKYGPFDVTLIENGAYNVNWAPIHMQPEETVQAHRDLRGGWLVPIHNGTFDLAMHPWSEPMERIQALAAKLGVRVATPRFGEMVRLEAMTTGECWWRGVEGAKSSELAAAPDGELAS